MRPHSPACEQHANPRYVTCDACRANREAQNKRPVKKKVPIDLKKMFPKIFAQETVHG